MLYIRRRTLETMLRDGDTPCVVLFRDFTGKYKCTETVDLHMARRVAEISKQLQPKLPRVTAVIRLKSLK